MADSLTFVRVVQVVDRAAGALVVYSKSSYYDHDTIMVKNVGNQEGLYYAQMTEFTSDDGTRVYAAIFPALPHANYDIYHELSSSSYGKWGRTTVFAGAVVAFEEE